MAPDIRCKAKLIKTQKWIIFYLSHSSNSLGKQGHHKIVYHSKIAGMEEYSAVWSVVKIGSSTFYLPLTHLQGLGFGRDRRRIFSTVSRPQNSLNGAN